MSRTQEYLKLLVEEIEKDSIRSVDAFAIKRKIDTALEIAARNAFNDHLKESAEVVNAWPEWKQGILSKSLSPSVSELRKPVDNG